MTKHDSANTSGNSKMLRDLRNIGIIAHIDAGKTTVSERILFYTEAIHRMGEVHEGAATMDFMPEEQEHGITIASACNTCHWNGCQINLIDTPGHVDFTIEVERCLRVLDAAVGVFCAVSGVEPQSETVWRQSEKFGLPKLAFVNKLDRKGADFSAVLESMRRRLGANPLPVTVPLGEGEDFVAIADIIKMERLDFDESGQGRVVTRSKLTTEEKQLVSPWRERLFEVLSEHDDKILGAYLLGEELPETAIIESIRQATIACRLVPVFAGSALRNKGIQPLLDGVVAFLPSPQDRAIEAKDASGQCRILNADPEGPLAALVFKITMEQGRKLALVRIYSGKLEQDMGCFNSSNATNEKINHIYKLHANHREELKSALAGEIVAVSGLKTSQTGDTLCKRDHMFLLEKIMEYQPVISLALEPKNKEEADKLDEVLARFSAEDPTVKVETDESTGQRLLSGMGELHLEILLERMLREYKLEPRSGHPRVVCRETVRQSATGTGHFERELGGVPHFGHVELLIEPKGRGEGEQIEFALEDQTDDPTSNKKKHEPPKSSSGKNNNAAASGNWPAPWLQAVQEGVAGALHSGPLNGYPMADVSVKITKLERKEGQSSPAGYQMAAGAALREAMGKADPALLEPIMRLEITTPDNFVGSVVSLLGTRGAKLESINEDNGNLKSILAFAPMRELFGFSTDLRSVSQGRTGMNIRFDKFDLA